MPDIAFEPVMGASGDMILGALFDLGADPAAIECELRAAGLNGFHLHFTHTEGHHHVRYGRCEVHVEGEEEPQAADSGQRTVDGRRWTVGSEQHNHQNHDHSHPHPPTGHCPPSTVHCPPPAHHRGLRDILEIIGRLRTPQRAKERSTRIFTRLAEAEAQVHGIAPEKVHFHEVGAVDSIVDIVGACIALEQLGIDRVYCSALKVGTGTIRCAHGVLPNPAPATVRLLEGSKLPVVRLPIEMELTTPTGAAILTTLAEGDWTGLPLRWTRSGSGHGGRTLAEGPNIIRAHLVATAPIPAEGTLKGVHQQGAPENSTPLDCPSAPLVYTLQGAHAPPASSEEITVLETDLDDESPEVAATLPDLLRQAGALDATLTPLLMKKGRPGVRLTVLAKPADSATLAKLILTHSSSIGVRTWSANRYTLPREAGTVVTPWGEVRTKRVTRPNGTVEATPEFESCRELAEKTGIPLRQIMHAARNTIDVL